MIKVVIADDHRVVLQGLFHLLNYEHDIEVVGQALDGLDAIVLVDKYEPDVLVMDLMMPNLNGLEVARQLQRRKPNLKIIILSMHDSEPYIRKAMRYGVSGYIPKESSGEELVKAIRKVITGERYLSPILPILSDSYSKANYGEDDFDSYETLTERERVVFQMIAEGQSNSDIAEILSISLRTVESHRANIYRKLDLNSQTDILRFAIKRGIILIDG